MFIFGNVFNIVWNFGIMLVKMLLKIDDVIFSRFYVLNLLLEHTAFRFRHIEVVQFGSQLVFFLPTFHPFTTFLSPIKYKMLHDEKFIILCRYNVWTFILS